MIYKHSNVFFSTSDSCWPEKQNLRQEIKPLGLFERCFLGSIPKRKSEVLAQQQKGGFKNRLFEMCQYVVPVVRQQRKRQATSEAMLPKRQGFSTAQPKTIHASH